MFCSVVRDVILKTYIGLHRPTNNKHLKTAGSASFKLRAGGEYEQAEMLRRTCDIGLSNPDAAPTTDVSTIRRAVLLWMRGIRISNYPLERSADKRDEKEEGCYCHVAILLK